MANFLYKEFQETPGWEPYKAPEEVSIGEWQPAILNALKKADVFVVVYTKESWGSQNLWKEIVLAEEWGITTLPVVKKDLKLEFPRFPGILRKSKIVRFDSKKRKDCLPKVLTMLRLHEFTLPYATELVQAFVS
jgi:hypothetical protein